MDDHIWGKWFIPGPKRYNDVALTAAGIDN